MHKEVKLRAQHLEKHHVAALSIRVSGGTLKLRTAADGTGSGFDIVFAKEAPRVRLARSDQREGPPEPLFEEEEADASKLLAVHEKLAAAATELTRHRKGIVEATLDGELLRTHAKPALLVERLFATIAPIVQEIASRSQSPRRARVEASAWRWSARRDPSRPVELHLAGRSRPIIVDISAGGLRLRSPGDEVPVGQVATLRYVSCSLTSAPAPLEDG